MPERRKPEQLSLFPLTEHEQLMENLEKIHQKIERLRAARNKWDYDWTPEEWHDSNSNR